MKKPNQNDDIYIDCDVLIHFIKGERLFDLIDKLKYKIVICDVVKTEVCQRKISKEIIEKFLRKENVKEINLADNFEALREYADLIKTKGKGEAACLALGKVNKKQIFSSNKTDIDEYCKDNKIEAYTTMDILLNALYDQEYTPEECNAFIKKVKEKGSKLPCNTIEQYAKRYGMKSRKVIFKKIDKAS